MRAADAVLPARLDAIAGHAGRAISRVHARRAATRAAGQAVIGLFACAAALLVLQLVWRALGRAIPGGWALIAFPLGAALWVALAWLRARLASVPRRTALAAMDHTLRSEERLVTADDFLARPELTSFMEAAVADAEPVVLRALKTEPVLFAPLWRPDGAQRLGLAAAFACLLLVFMLGSWTPPPGEPEGDTHLAAAGQDTMPIRRTTDDGAEAPRAPLEEPPPTATRPPSSGRERSEETRDRDLELSDQTKESEGKTGAGRAADAQSASGRSQSRGAPSDQAQTSKREEPRKKPDPPKPNREPGNDPDAARKKRAEEESGSTAGRGSSRGSNKNPAVSSWSSKDQVTTQDDQELEDDEETEDEEEDQEARGGVQPALRDRKPPVSRDLQIGFGNQKNPDANGRGGPSQPKKSRGTASLVLGVPVPDRVKGQPNPGRTKITQERIEPRAEESEPIEAAARRPRAAPSGHVGRPDLEPWMRELVRAYFLELRRNAPGES